MHNINKIKEIVLSCYKDISQKSKMEDFARYIDDPFLVEFSEDFENVLQAQKDLFFKKEEQEPESDEFEELEEINDEIDQYVDIEKLTQIENKVIQILQYLNLEFYQEDRIKEIIIDSMLKNLSSAELTEIMREKVEDVIAYLVEHEFKELTLKKKERRKALIIKLMEKVDPVLKERLDKHFSTKVKEINNINK